jgi:hypothetical protein
MSLTSALSPAERMLTVFLFTMIDGVRERLVKADPVP